MQPTDHQPARRLANLAASLLTIAALFVAPSVAHAGTYTVYSCQTPAGVQAPTDGWAAEPYGSNDFSSYARNNCASTPSAGNLSTNCATDLSTNSCNVWRAGWQSVMHYRAAPDTIFAKLTVWRTAWVTHNYTESAAGPYWAGWLGVGSPSKSDAVDSCGYESTIPSGGGFIACQKGTGTDSHSVLDANRISIEPPGGTHDVYMVAACVGGGQTPQYCNPDGSYDLDTGQTTSGGSVDYEIQALAAQVRDDSLPTVSNVAGDLASASILNGTPTLTFDAADKGAGLYRVVVQRKASDADQWKTASNPIINDNGGKCAQLDYSSTDDYEFGYTQPCALAASGRASLNTAALKDGRYDIRVLVEDASGNQAAVVEPRTVSIANSPNATACASCSPPAPPTAAASPTTPAAAAPSAHFTAQSRRTITARYGKRRNVTGRLVNDAGDPISGAPVEVTDGAVHATVTTDAQGHYRYRTRRGRSRTVTFGHRSAPGTDYDDTAAVVLRVHGAIRIRTRKRSLPHNGLLRLDGHLLGAGSGAEIQIQAQDGKRWRTIDLLSTDKKGRVHYRYHFKRATGATFLFRMKMTDQPKVGLLAATSKTVTVRVR